VAYKSDIEVGAGSHAVAAAELGYALLPAQPFQYDADLLFS
jgi:hypothetical protein